MILCILLYLNAFNMFDGINLQASLYSINIFLIFILKGIFLDISLVMILSLLFFSYLNFKNKCFLGNNGSLLIAFVIS
jgi:UDP-N-acetylmuramyl pentapeptide phosphotransferase/UDP-N-acetylglucosamine-1-phosphate transferase